MKREFALPSVVEQKLRQYLLSQGKSLDDASLLNSEVKALSDHFISTEGAKTPWDLANAYLVYFFPLNFARVSASIHEAFQEFPWDQVNEIIDFGSGPGTVHAALSASHLKPRPLINVEVDSRAMEIHRQFDWGWPCTHTKEVPRNVAAGSLGIFSYSLLEEAAIVNKLKLFDHVLLISPSTRSQGQVLLKIRDDLIKEGYFAWAPCTHQLTCPMNHPKSKDWCHDRIFFDRPTWYQSLENHLPIKNETLTFSYLFMSRVNRTAEANTARVVGDTLYEKGKVRQMICRGPEREFLSWLKKFGEPEMIPRGSRITLPSDIELKGNELRVPHKHSFK